ncbi:hypothetical protein TNCV_1752151 [Trichonephila clavipes]|nr:hypothetical protein TNCV_1752151 [Trichonephila clavipes]
MTKALGLEPRLSNTDEEFVSIAPLPLQPQHFISVFDLIFIHIAFRSKRELLITNFVIFNLVQMTMVAPELEVTLQTFIPHHEEFDYRQI